MRRPVRRPGADACTFQGLNARWLRWCDADGKLLPLASERADEERARAERRAAKLRELGVDEEAL